MPEVALLFQSEQGKLRARFPEPAAEALPSPRRAHWKSLRREVRLLDEDTRMNGVGGIRDRSASASRATAPASAARQGLPFPGIRIHGIDKSGQPCRYLSSV